MNSRRLNAGLPRLSSSRQFSLFAGGVLSALAAVLLSDWLRPKTPPAAFESPHYPPGYPLPSSENIQIKSEFTSSVSFRFKQPNWVAERRIAQGDEALGDRKKSEFLEDRTVPEIFRSRNGDYWDSGWSRGHLAPAGAHKTNQQVMDETFVLSSNIVPQDLSMNGADWLRLENLVDWLVKKKKDIFVVSGPLWIPEVPGPMTVTYPVIGETQIPVPTHLFKIVMQSEPTILGKKEAVAIFVMPNRPIPDERPLTSYQVELEHVEKASGLDFSAFRNKPDLCLIEKCNGGRSGDRVNSWRLYGDVQEAKGVKELRALVKKGVDRGFLTESNFLLIKIMVEKAKKFGLRALEDLFDDEKYRAACLEGEKILRRKNGRSH